MGTLNKEVAIRNQSRREKIEKIQAKQVEFLSEYMNLTQTVLPGITEINTDKPLERAYQLLESVVSNLQTQLQAKKDEQKGETFVLLRH